MLDRSVKAEFEGYRKTLPTDEAGRAFDERIERLLSQHGIDYVRGYVGALSDLSRDLVIDHIGVTGGYDISTLQRKMN